VPLIPPYTNGNGQDLEIEGWYYVAIVACLSIAAIIYYLVAFAYAPNRSGGTHAELLARSAGVEGSHGHSIMTFAGVHPELFEEDDSMGIGDRFRLLLMIRYVHITMLDE